MSTLRAAVDCLVERGAAVEQMELTGCCTSCPVVDFLSKKIPYFVEELGALSRDDQQHGQTLTNAHAVYAVYAVSLPQLHTSDPVSYTHLTLPTILLV